MTGNTDLQHRAARLVDREVNACLSSLVATLAKGAHFNMVAADLSELTERAMELVAPVLDYESAAREHPGIWQLALDGTVWRNDALTCVSAPDWQAACELDNIEPHELEVFEHWAVSSWLAEKLIAKGERVDTDFAGLCVWARTTTGQAISADSVIEAITAETGYLSGGEA